MTDPHIYITTCNKSKSLMGVPTWEFGYISVILECRITTINSDNVMAFYEKKKKKGVFHREVPLL